MLFQNWLLTSKLDYKLTNRVHDIRVDVNNDPKYFLLEFSPPTSIFENLNEPTLLFEMLTLSPLQTFTPWE